MNYTDGIDISHWQGKVNFSKIAKACISDGEITAKGNTWKKLLEKR